MKKEKEVENFKIREARFLRRFPNEPDEFLSPFSEMLYRLDRDGIPIEIDLPSDDLAVLLAEVANFLAKVWDYRYYELKPQLIDYAASLPSIRSGWGEDGAFYLFSPKMGVVSFHDPNGEIQSKGHWPYPWSGISRQRFCLEILYGNSEMLEYLRIATSPSFE
jgi:hypothetical protein